MNKTRTIVLAKSASHSGTTEPQEKTFNAKTIAAHKEAQKIMNGEKKTKSYSSAEEFLTDLKA